MGDTSVQANLASLRAGVIAASTAVVACFAVAVFLTLNPAEAQANTEPSVASAEARP